MPGIMDFFRPSTPATAAAPTQPAPATPQGDANKPAEGTQSSGNHSNTTTPNLPVNPLDAYKNMYDNMAKATPEAPPQFALDSKTVGEVTSSLDFTKDVPPDLMTKALAGDAQALIQAMNHVARGAYQTTLQHNALLTDKFVGSRLEFDGKSLGSRVKQEMTSSALATTPNYNHPVLKTELNRIAGMLAKEHPDATPQQIAESAHEYLKNVTAALSPQENKPQAQEQEFDWTKYLGG